MEGLNTDGEKRNAGNSFHEQDALKKEQVWKTSRSETGVLSVLCSLAR